MGLNGEFVGTSSIWSYELEVTAGVNGNGLYNLAVNNDVNLGPRFCALDVSGDLAASFNLSTILGGNSWSIDEQLNCVTADVALLSHVIQRGIEGKVVCVVLDAVGTWRVSRVDAYSVVTHNGRSTGVTLVQNSLSWVLCGVAPDNAYVILVATDEECAFSDHLGAAPAGGTAGNTDVRTNDSFSNTGDVDGLVALVLTCRPLRHAWVKVQRRIHVINNGNIRTDWVTIERRIVVLVDRRAGIAWFTELIEAEGTNLGTNSLNNIRSALLRQAQNLHSAIGGAVSSRKNCISTG